MLRSARSAIAFLAITFFYEAVILIFDAIFTGFVGNTAIVNLQYFDVVAIFVALLSGIAVVVTRNILILAIFFFLSIFMLAAFVVDLVLRNGLIGFPGIIAFITFFATIGSIILFAIVTIQQFRNGIETNDINQGKVQPLQSERIVPTLVPVVTPTPAPVVDNASTTGMNYGLTTLTKRNVGQTSNEGGV
jgi:hypothetical protein